MLYVSASEAPPPDVIPGVSKLTPPYLLGSSSSGVQCSAVSGQPPEMQPLHLSLRQQGDWMEDLYQCCNKVVMTTTTLVAMNSSLNFYNLNINGCYLSILLVCCM